MPPLGPQFPPDEGGTPWYEALPYVGPDAAEKAPPASHFPLPGWPAMPTVEYLTKLIILALLLLALPYLIGAVLTRPESLLSGKGGLSAVAAP